MFRKRLLLFAVLSALTLVVSACGGGSGDEPGLGEVFDGIGDAAGENDNDGGGGIPGAGEAGAVTVTADPSVARVEVDGQTIEFTVPGSVHHSCYIDEDRVSINYQQTESGDLLIQGQNLGDGWLLNLTVVPLDSNIQYGASLPGNGNLGIDGEALSYEGPVDKVEDRDIANASQVDVELAVNCEAPGDGIQVALGGTEYDVRFSGSVICEFGDEAIDVSLGDARAFGGAQDAELQFNVIKTEDGWFGVASVRTADSSSYRSEVTAEATQPTIDGMTISYEGVFSSDAGDVDGSMSFTCP